jgi:hypothetical protein
VIFEGYGHGISNAERVMSMAASVTGACACIFGGGRPASPQKGVCEAVEKRCFSRQKGFVQACGWCPVESTKSEARVQKACGVPQEIEAKSR